MWAPATLKPQINSSIRGRVKGQSHRDACQLMFSLDSPSTHPQTLVVPILQAVAAATTTLAVGEPESEALEAGVTTSAGPHKGKEMRSAALRLWAELLERFPEDLDFSSFWDAWFCAVEPLMGRLTMEVGGVFLLSPQCWMGSAP